MRSRDWSSDVWSSGLGDRLEKLSRRLEMDDTLHDLSGEGLDRVIEEVDVSEDLTGHGAVVSDPTTLERFDQIRDLGSHTSLGQLREHHGVFLTGDEHLDHLPARLGPHARRDSRQLEPGVLDELLQALDLLATSQIGTEWCRERVGQYGKFTVVGAA